MQNNSTKRESVRKVILALLISHSQEVSLEKLNNEYKNEEGEYIPWKELGYISLYNCLQDMPNISLKRINDSYYVTGTASDKSKHISSLVARQKKGNCKGKLAKSSRYFPNTAPPKIHIPSEVLSNMICTIKQYPCGIDKQYIVRILRSQCPNIRILIDDLDNILKELSHIVYTQDNLIFPKESKTDSSSDKCYVDNMQTSLTKTEEKINFQNTDTKSRYCVSGDSDSEINTDDNDLNLIETNNINGNYENGKTNKRQPISTFIQETVSKSNEFNNTLIHNTEEILHDNSTNNRIKILADKMQKYEEDITYLNEENAKLLISDRTKFRLEKLMQKYPNGIWCAELPIKYLKEYNVPLNYIELGFSSVREFASYLPEIFSCKQLQPSGDYILYNANNELNDIIKKERRKFQNMCEMYSLSLQDDNELEALPILVSPDTSNKLIPEGVMTMGESVGYINVTNLENGIQPYIEVFVEEVFTPSFFWVQLRKKRKLFNKLMEELDAFYQEKCMLYKIPPVVIEKGLNCACLYNKEWHRGIIKKVKPNLQVTVMFYDYGTLKTYPPDAIYYLHRSFSYLPAQAIPCGLYNTKPCTSRNWSPNAIREFALKIHQKPLIATIASTDPENNSMLVTLTDTMEEEDVHINDWLVHQNLAVHGTLVCMSRENFPYCHYLQCKKNYKTNVKDLVSSNDLTKSPVSHHLHASSNHVVSTSVKNNTVNNFSSNNSKKGTKLLQNSENNFIANNYVNAPIELIDLFKSTVNTYKLRPNHKKKSNITRLHNYSNSVHGNESKKELHNVEISSHISSSVESDNSKLTLSENNCSEKQKKCKKIPLLKKCFENAVNFSIDTESCLDCNTLLDDNINFKNDNSELKKCKNVTKAKVTKRNCKPTFTNAKIEVPEEILFKLQKSNTSYKDELENVIKSLDQVKVDSQLNMSCNDKTISKCLEQAALNESILEDVEEIKDMKIKTFNDIDVESDNSEWAVEGNIQDFFS